MNGLMKNLLLALTLVCVIALIVFCIQLIVFNRDVEPVPPGAGVVRDFGQNEEEVNGDIDDGDADDGDGVSIGNAPVDNWQPIRIGERYEFLVTPNRQIVAYADETMFEFEESDSYWVFNYIFGGTAVTDETEESDEMMPLIRRAALEITFVLPTVHGIETLSVEFLNGHTGSVASAFNGEMTIPGTRLTGYNVTTHHLGRSYEAWIHNLIDSDVSLVFIVSYENDTQRHALYQLLGSIDIVAVGLSDPAMDDYYDEYDEEYDY